MTERLIDWVDRLATASDNRILAETIMAAIGDSKTDLVTTGRFENETTHQGEILDLKFEGLRSDLKADKQELKSEVQKILVEQSKGQNRILLAIIALVIAAFGVLARLYNLI